MNRNIKNNFKKLIINSYNDLLKRDPDDSGMNYFLSLLEKEKINDFQLCELIKSSPEFMTNNYNSIPVPIYPEKLKEIPDPKIVGIFRIKNEERWIEKSLEAASEICQEIVILDDGSTDNTLKICKSFSSVVDIHEQKNLPFDDTRDKNQLLKMALKRKPEFIFSHDGDEIIMPKMKDVLKEDLTILHPEADVYEMEYLDMREKPNKFRINDPTALRFSIVFYRMKNQPKNLHFEETRFPGNLHCTVYPQNTVGIENPARSRVKVLHYSLYDEEIRLKKYHHYKKLDPDNTEFFGYEHLINPEKYTGPLEFAYLPKGSYIENIK